MPAMPSPAIPFGEFYHDVHGRMPFDWQSALADRVHREGWPRSISMPTASGKTSVLDIAVWHLACEAARGRTGPGRAAPVRVAMVVDRRMSVDDSYRHARAISDALARKGGGSAASRAAEALSTMSSGAPLTVKRLRGGMPQDSGWGGSPSDPTIILSTVDQIGSRLLFRGYGVSWSMRPVHAGLLGTDTLYILDEAHLSGPFVRLLCSVGDMRRKMGWDGQGPFVEMSATPRSGRDGAFPDPGQRPALIDEMGDRASVSKPAELVAVAARASPAALADRAKKIMGGAAAPRRIGIVVNTVGAAREVFEKVRSHAGRCGYEVNLLTGRSRPLCRELLTGRIVGGLRPGSASEERSVTVSTQCIEAGADITFDALLTQAAPLDSLLQRFGRLNRIGDGAQGEAAIVADGRDIGPKADDPVYGQATDAAWSWIGRVSEGSRVDFGVKAFQMPPDDKIEGMSSPKRATATLLPAYVRAWHRTQPPGSPDPDVALFLHGMPDRGAQPADVNVVWRHGRSLEDVQMSAELIPPTALESIQVPVWHVRRWLEDVRALESGSSAERGQDGTSLSAHGLADVEGQSTAQSRGSEESAMAIRVVHGVKSKCVGAGRIRPGDTVAVPSSYGGCDEFGWTGKAGGRPVKDISTQAHLIQRGKLALRTDGGPVRDAAGDATWDALAEAALEESAGSEAALGAAVAEIGGMPEGWREAARLGGDAEVVRRRDGTAFGVAFKKALDPDRSRAAIRVVSPDASGMVAEYSTGWDSTGGGRVVALRDHLDGVGKVAKEFSKKLGLRDADASAITTAARLHDIGKEEKTMQAVLHCTTREGLEGKDVIAKSATRGKRKREECKCLAGMPDGYRHEWFSARRAMGMKEVHDGGDGGDLALWLIGTHHGYGRPVFPAGTWTEGVDPWWCGLAERVYGKHGPWKLAYMEAVLRMADWRRSDDERRPGLQGSGRRAKPSSDGGAG